MPTITKRGSAWRVQVRKGGQSHSASFQTKAAAQQWATSVEADIIAGKLGAVADRPFSELIDRYLLEVTPKKKGSREEELRLRRILRDEIASVRVAQLGPEHFAAWRDRRLQSVSAASVLREWTTLTHVCSVAIKEWRWLRENPLSQVKRPKDNPPRQRVWTQDEIDAVLLACGTDYSTAMGRVGLALLFSLETAMRAGEICDMEWQHVSSKVVHIPRTKNGEPRDVSLTKRAIEILQLVKPYTATKEHVFDITAPSRDTLFRKAKSRALVTGVTFHDARATALTRLSRRLNVMQLARMSGHRDLRILQNVYYREKAEDISDLLNDE